MRIALLIEYNGSSFNGWQYQPNGRTVQGELQRVFKKILGTEIVVHGSGRTDAGVHAMGQVAHLDVPDNALPVPLEKLCFIANPLLMPDVRLRQAVRVGNDFHSRFKAIEREYRYYITYNDSVFLRPYMWHLRQEPDIALMQAVGDYVIGTRDFTVLSKYNATTPDYTCNLKQCAVTYTPSGLCITMVANRFVYSMCRAIVGAMVSVAQDRLSFEEFVTLINAGNRTERLPLAPFHALFLNRVSYHSDIFDDEPIQLFPLV
jgi:tRNA pseudouridine38-40 synthase